MYRLILRKLKCHKEAMPRKSKGKKHDPLTYGTARRPQNWKLNEMRQRGQLENS